MSQVWGNQSEAKNTEVYLIRGVQQVTLHQQSFSGHYSGAVKHEGAGLHLATRFNIVLREVALSAVQDALIPAVVMALSQVDDVALGEGQLIELHSLIAVQRPHWTHKGTAVRQATDCRNDVITANCDVTSVPFSM